MASFYVFLPSNADRGDLIGKFTAKLPERIKLEGEWEVSMREFNYTRSWMNINSVEDSLIQIINFPSENSMSHAYLPYNDYHTPEELIEAIKYTVRRFSKKMLWSRLPEYEFYYDKLLKRCTLRISEEEKGFELFVSSKVGYMLGFTSGRISEMMEVFDTYRIKTGHFLPDMNAGLYALIVHCDLVAPQLVGNTYANLLRMVPVTGRLNENITNIYHDEQYLPVLNRNFESIEININDDSGKIINFQFGRTYITLHFRKRRR